MPNAICVHCLSRLCEHVMPPGPRITPRNAEFLVLLAGGLSYKEIAQQLGLTAGSVKVSFSRDIFPALGLTSQLEAALWASRHLDLLKPVNK